MASPRVKKFLILVLIAVLNASAPARGEALLSEEQDHMALCVKAIAPKYFSCGRSLIVSMPRDVRHVTGRPLAHLSYSDDLHLVNMALQKINENTCCPVQLFPADTELTTIAEMNYNYIIFIWREQEDGDIIDSLRRQLDILCCSEIRQWNPRGRFVVVVTDHISGSPRSIALEIYETMWVKHNIIDNVIITPHSERNHLEKQMKNPSSERNILDLYSGFPYQTGNCEKVKEVTLVDQCVFQNNVTFSYKVNLFPPKIPKDFQNCVIRVETIGTEPFVTLVKNHTQKNGNTVYEVRGLSVEYFLLSIKKMNMTVVFLPPSLEISLEAVWRIMGNLVRGTSDVIVGSVPMLPIIITEASEPSVPYIYDKIKWFVPCPKSVSRVEKIITMYNASVWLTMTIVFILTSIVVWCSANFPDRLATKECNPLQTITNCMYSAWGIFIGVSVTEMSKTWRFRVFFLFYACYCFSMSTVFQAFFISYLVAPGYGKKVETFQELLDSNVAYGFNMAMEMGMMTTDYTDHLKFPASRRADCSDLENCIKRMISDRDVATIADPLHAQYVASKFGTEGEMKVPCALEENLIDGSIVALLRKGSPILNQLNKFIRRCQEGGLVERYWAELNFDALLKRKPECDKDSSGRYFVFSLSHTGPAFTVLLFGYAVSFLVCLAECFHKCINKRQYDSGEAKKRMAMAVQYMRRKTSGIYT
jgi:hypothetical protein